MKKQPTADVLEALAGQQEAPEGPGNGDGKGGGKGGKSRRRRKGAAGAPNPSGPDQPGGDVPAPTVPKHNKKVTSKITSISSKLTEVRCLSTQLQGHAMCLGSNPLDGSDQILFATNGW